VVKVIELKYAFNFSLVITSAEIDTFLSIKKGKIEIKKPAKVMRVSLVHVEKWYVKNLNVENKCKMCIFCITYIAVDIQQLFSWVYLMLKLVTANSCSFLTDHYSSHKAFSVCYVVTSHCLVVASDNGDSFTFMLIANHPL
jgi:hypothetical protein